MHDVELDYRPTKKTVDRKRTSDESMAKRGRGGVESAHACVQLRGGEGGGPSLGEMNAPRIHT